MSNRPRRKAQAPRSRPRPTSGIPPRARQRPVIVYLTKPRTRPKLTPKQLWFAAEYLVDLNATQAAIRVGYSAQTACQQGSRLLRNVHVSALVARRKLEQLTKADLTASRVLEELRRISFADFRTFFDEDDNLKPMHELTPEQGSQLASMEVIIKNAQAGDGITDTVHKFKTWDKVRSLEALCRHFGLLKDQIDLQLSGDLVAILNAGRERAALARASRAAGAS